MAREANGIVVRDYTGDYKDYSKWFDEQMAKIGTNSNPHASDLTGSILRWQRADSWAYYVVTKHSPLTIAHIDICDGWRIEPALIRGLRITDVRQQLLTFG
tara:strand:- start:328 stop:630 length:303 start_codon:yes stop_codon:yes gene_type:complete